MEPETETVYEESVLEDIEIGETAVPEVTETPEAPEAEEPTAPEAPEAAVVDTGVAALPVELKDEINQFCPTWISSWKAFPRIKSRNLPVLNILKCTKAFEELGIT